MQKNIALVPFSIKSKTMDGLTRKCLENNRINDIEFDYYRIVYDGKQWVAWFRADARFLKRVR